jgi:hypothetical protein
VLSIAMLSAMVFSNTVFSTRRLPTTAASTWLLRASYRVPSFATAFCKEVVAD